LTPMADIASAFADFARCGELRELSFCIDDRPATSGELQNLEQLQKLTTLSVGGRCLDDQLVASIARLPALERLLLRSNAISDEGIRSLGALSALKRLIIDYSHGFRGTGFGGPAAFPHLETLSLKGSAIDDDGLAAIASLPALRELQLNGTSLTSSAISPLQGLRSLRSLHLARVPLDDRAVDVLGKMTWLSELRPGHGLSPEARERLAASLPDCQIW
jgi:Leucine-rich repeat (LRR) protein